MKKKALFGLVLTVAISFSGLQTQASKSVTDLKEEQKEIAESQKEAAEKLNETAVKKTKAMKELDQIDKELMEAAEKLNGYESDLDNTKLTLKNTEFELENAIALKDEQYDVFKKRVKYMYENGKMGYVNVILESEDLMDFQKRAEYVNYIVEYDNDVVDKLKNAEEQVSTKLGEVEKQKESIEGLVYLQGVEKQKIEEKIDKKSAYIAQLQLDEAEYNAQIQDLQNSNLEIEKEIKKIQAEEEAKRKAAEEAAARERAKASQSSSSSSKSSLPAPVYTGGKLAWPVPGKSYISSPFGYRGSPISGKREFHTGIDIPAPTGTNIVAAEGGTVIKAGWVNGYGNTVIINHGNGLTSLYAHNSRLTVSNGSSVSRGETIAKAGSTGYSTGPHSHFEVRLNGSAVNPINYVK